MRLLKQFIAASIVCVASFAYTDAYADFTFAAYGDTPYTDEEEKQHINLIGELNHESLAFVIHIGDIKSGWAPCTDALFLRRRDEFAMVHHALIYTPGDNEWTDCWRGSRLFGTARDPLERLQKLRSLFFADPYSLGQRKIMLTRQNTAYPEHARWEHEGIVFATLNVPGSSNNARIPAESAPRNQAAEAWIANTFEIARTQGRRAVVLAFHADPFSGDGSVSPPYISLMTAITRETMNFKGEVLLIHGDTHRYRVDQPLTDPQTKQVLKNFTRIEVFGYPYVNWVRVRVSERDGRTIFTASPGSP